MKREISVMTCPHCARRTIHHLPLRLDLMGYLRCPKCEKWAKVQRAELVAGALLAQMQAGIMSKRAFRALLGRRHRT